MSQRLWPTQTEIFPRSDSFVTFSIPSEKSPDNLSLADISKNRNADESIDRCYSYSFKQALPQLAKENAENITSKDLGLQ